MGMIIHPSFTMLCEAEVTHGKTIQFRFDMLPQRVQDRVKEECKKQGMSDKEIELALSNRGGINDEQSEQVALHEFAGSPVVKQLLRIPWDGVQLRPTAGQDAFRDEVVERDVLCVAERRRRAVLSGQHNWHFYRLLSRGQAPSIF